MAEEEEEYEYIPDEEDFVPPKYRAFVRIRRQFSACSCFFFAAFGVGVYSYHLYRIHTYLGSHDLELPKQYIDYTPLWGDLVGIIVAVPLVYFLSRWYALFLSQTFLFVALFVNAFYHTQVSYNERGARKYLALPEEFVCLIVMHGCSRVFVIVMVVYMVEITQPSLRAPLLAAFYPPFIGGMYLATYAFMRHTTVIVATFFMFCSFTLIWTVPESPYWQARKGNYEGARATFTRLRAGDDNADEFEALLESTSSNVELKPLLADFGSALVKMVFLFMSTDNICRVFWSAFIEPKFFFLYDNFYKHEITIKGATDSEMYYPALCGSLVFILAVSFLGRRILYLTSILVSLLVWYIQKKYLPSNKGIMGEWRLICVKICYFVSLMGSIQVVLIVSGELFPGRIREFGVAVCQLMQLYIQYLDYKGAAQSEEWEKYTDYRMALVPIGLLMTFIFLPETKNLTLLEAEIAGAKMEPVVKIPFTKNSEEPEPGEENVGEENIEGEE